MNNVVYLKDCMEGMKEYPDKYFELAIVDPPYGINIGRKIGGNTPFGGKAVAIGGGIIKAKTYHGFNDQNIPSAEYFAELERIAKHRIIWGGNYFIENLANTSCVIVWDKKRRGLNFADCELAWTDFNKPCRIIEYKWNGLLQEDMKNKEIRIHPTQKPVDLYAWILNNFAEKGDKILDTHVGSGSSRIACYDLGFDFTGFEIDEEYWKLQEHRFEVHTRQQRLELF